MKLPEQFLSRMQNECGEEFPSFLASYDSPAQRAVRVNTLKLNKEEFQKICPFPLGERVPWEENGFYVEEEKLGRYAEHFAGLFYSQEPSAMCAAPLLEVHEGDFVLDLCSAPGGKGGKLAELTKGKGVVVLNEIVPSRAQILLQNVERMGVKNAVVTNSSPQELCAYFPNAFDKILVDAPCSGEGMFKKNEEEALENWSEENVSFCARRQSEILECAHKMLKKGGTLVYSTCTFSREEDEEQIQNFLLRHGEYLLLKEEKLLPHRVKGEGHYAACLKKTEGDEGEVKRFKFSLSAADEKLYRAFEKEFLSVRLTNIYRAKDSFYALPEGMFAFQGLKVLRAGVKVASVLKDRLEPCHALAMSLKKEEVNSFVSLKREEAEKYLRGEQIVLEGKKGWCVVGYLDYPLGIGKLSDGVVKNHYPKGLRLRSGS